MSAVHSLAGSGCHTCKATDHFKRKTSQRSRTFCTPTKAFWPFSHAAKSTSAASAREAKSKLAQLVGKKYGHDLSDSQKQGVREVLKELEALETGDMRQKELLGNWKLIYTESTGSSGGKIGPLVGQVDQVFPKDQPGIYVNKLQLGPIRADLSANYEYSERNKIDVSFIDIAAFLGPLQIVKKDFGGQSGFWKLTYHDQDLRILYTNQGNVFVLERAD